MRGGRRQRPIDCTAAGSEDPDVAVGREGERERVCVCVGGRGWCVCVAGVSAWTGQGARAKRPGERGWRPAEGTWTLERRHTRGRRSSARGDDKRKKKKKQEKKRKEEQLINSAGVYSGVADTSWAGRSRRSGTRCAAGTLFALVDLSLSVFTSCNLRRCAGDCHPAASQNGKLRALHSAACTRWDSPAPAAWAPPWGTRSWAGMHQLHALSVPACTTSWNQVLAGTLNSSIVGTEGERQQVVDSSAHSCG